MELLNNIRACVCRVPAPHVVAARAYRMSSPSPGSGTGSTALYRLARLLNQGSKQPPHAVDDTNVTRRLSWERQVIHIYIPTHVLLTPSILTIIHHNINVFQIPDMYSK